MLTPRTIIVFLCWTCGLSFFCHTAYAQSSTPPPMRPGNGSELEIKGGELSWPRTDVYKRQIFFVTSVLSTIATFTLGATLWQKNSFLKTVSALFLFSIVFSFSCSLFLTNEEIGSAVSYLFIGKFFDNSSNFFWLINTVQIAETIILGYIGYLRMKELEINETKR